MKEGWQLSTLDQLGKIVTGKTPATADPENYGGSIPFVSPSDMQGQRIIDDVARYLSDVGATKVRNSIIPARAVMVSCIGSDMGKPAIAARRCVTNQQINSIIASSDNDPLFIYYNLSARKEEIKGSASGSAQPILNKSAFGRMKIDLPPLPEQRAIAATLGALDDKIELNRKMNATLEAMARALFRDWFVDFGPTRAKMEGREPYLSPDLWSLFPDRLDAEGKPEGWEQSSIGSKLRTLLGGTPSRKEMAFWGGHIPWINSGKANEFRVIEPSEYITQQGFDKSATKMLPRRTTLIAITGATLGQVSLNEIETCANQSIVGVMGSADYPGEFVYLWVKENIDRLVAAQTGGAQQHINKGNVDELSFLCPTPEVLNAWIHLIKPIFDQISANCFESRTLAQTRDLLLPRLMSGALRVADALPELETA